ncbi:MAG TPA: hypothetical protein VHW04_17105 [Solirubrobacteraceae bacterium]|nr:hypothetical protein [Solirubrobacteraceae bacterium]
MPHPGSAYRTGARPGQHDGREAAWLLVHGYLNPARSGPNGAILAIGTEHFVGCLDADRNRACAGRDPRGTLALIYAFEARFDQQGHELSGGCQHPIMSGTGAFTGARGRIDFKDNVKAGTSRYHGMLTLKKSGHVSASASRAGGPQVPIC